MSLKFRDSSGVETPVAGLNGTSGELVPSVALMQSGTGNTDTISVGGYANREITFTTPMPDTDYVLNFNANLVGGILFTVMSKTVSSFVVNIWNMNDRELAVTFNWTAFKLMTDTVHEDDATHIAQNTANFAPAFSEVTSYAVGDYVTYNNVLYRCTTAHTAGVWVAGHFTQVTVGEDLSAIVPSDASASNKLVSKSNVPYINQTIIGVANVNLFGASLQTYGVKSLAGKASINGTWYDYVSSIQGNTASGGSWAGNAILWGDNGDFYTLRKGYSTSTTWVISKYVKENDLSIKKIDISAAGGSTSFSTTIPLSMAQRNKPFYLEVLSVGNSNAIKEMKYLVFVSSMGTTVATKEISKDSIFTNVSITFDASTGYELSFSSTATLYSTTVYIQQ